MEGVVVLVIIVGLVIVNNNINAKFQSLERTIESLQYQLRTLEHLLHRTQKATKKYEEDADISNRIKPTIPIITPHPLELEKESLVVSEDESVKVIKHRDEQQVVLNDNTVESHNKKQEPQNESTPRKSWFETFKEKHPDLEKFIGENLINKIGVLILVLGISFFIKYAIDKEWINEPARVGIGLLSGALVMAVAHKLKKNYASFSSVLVAGAISIFYFTIYIAFHEYHLFSQILAFIIMAVITAFSALVSISYNRQELAVLSLIGGFAAPFMLSTGDGNYVVLFSYIAILDVGILAISYFKKWKVATILAFIFTVIVFGSWCLTSIGDLDFSHRSALTFATLFYFIFSITIVLTNLKNRGVFMTIEYVLLIANTFFFFGIGMTILKDDGSNFTGFFTVLLALYNMLFAAVLYKNFGLDKNAVYLLIGLALTFVTLTIPIQFEGSQITIFWALEAVLLFWLSQKSRITHFQLGAIIVQILSVLSLLIDWQRYYTDLEEFPIFLNSLFVTGVVVSIAMFATNRLFLQEQKVTIPYTGISLKAYKNMLFVLAILVSYFTGILELIYQSHQYLANPYSALSIPAAYHFVFIAALWLIFEVSKKEILQKAVALISVISIVLYILFFYKLPRREGLENYILSTDSAHAFYLHYLILACLVFYGYQLFKKTKLLFHTQLMQVKWLPWLFVFATVYILSNEIMIHGLYFSKSLDAAELSELYPKQTDQIELKRQFVKSEIQRKATAIVKIGYPILWGIFSFILLITGIKRQWKTLRVIALSLLGLTIVKLFVYDIKNVSETGKIIAFILLGVLILIMSFVYQRIKKLVVDEDDTKHNESKGI